MFDIVSTYQHFHTIFYDFKIMNWSLTTLSLPVIGDWGLRNVFSFLNIVKQFLVLTCLGYACVNLRCINIYLYMPLYL